MGQELIWFAKQVYYSDVDYSLYDLAAPFPFDFSLQCLHRPRRQPLQKLCRLLPIKSYASTLDRESYQLEKHHYASYPNHVSIGSQSSLALVHSYVWSPCYFTLVSGF